MKRRFRYFAIVIGDCVEIRRGFEVPKRIVSKLQLPKGNSLTGPRHPETGEIIGTLLVQTYYKGGRVIAMCSYAKFLRVLGSVPKGCKELTKIEKDLVAPVTISLL